MAETATASPARTADEIKRDPLVAAAVARAGDAITDAKEFVGEITLTVAPDRIREVAAAFNVEGAYDRGYCDHNPNVTRLTDTEVHKLLNPVK